VQGRPDETGDLWSYPRALFARDPWVHRTPGFPCALCFQEGQSFMHTSGALRRGIERACVRLFENRTTKSVDRLAQGLDVEAAGTIEWK
jgi:hypothetical protein